MNISLYNQETPHGILQMEIEKSDYIDKVEKGLRNIRLTANVPGFRKGMAPMGIIKNVYGRQILLDELNTILNETLKSYFEANPDIQLIGSAMLNPDSLSNIELESKENITAIFDLPMSPKVDVDLDKDDVLPYLKVIPEDELTNSELEKQRQRYSSYSKEVETVLPDDILIKGKLQELENGVAREDGIFMEDAMLMPALLKNNEESSKFYNTTKGTVVVFNPRKAYEGATSPDEEIALLLNRAQKEVEHLDSDFSFEITSILQYQKAELNQKFFDHILGEKDSVQSLEDFMVEFKRKLGEYFTPDCDYYFLKELRPYLLNKAGELPIAEDLLKQQLIADNENLTEAEIEAEMPATITDIRFKLIASHLLERHDAQVTRADVEKMAYLEANRALYNYGIHQPTEEMIKSYIDEMMNNQKYVLQLNNMIREEKLVALAKPLVTLNIKEISISELEKMSRPESAEPAGE